MGLGGGRSVSLGPRRGTAGTCIVHQGVVGILALWPVAWTNHFQKKFYISENALIQVFTPSPRCVHSSTMNEFDLI